jgi:uncharacterized protein (DUF433 family)
MPLTINPVALPLWTDEQGAVRVGNSRVLLDIVINAYNQGDSPEEIMNHFPTLNLGDVYAVLGYYLHNRAEIDAFITTNAQAAESLRLEIEARQGSQIGLRNTFHFEHTSVS